MENDVLKNKIAPWQEKGRWYHGVLDINGNALVRDKCDQFIIDNFSLLTRSSKRHIVASNKIHVLDIILNFIDLVPASALDVALKTYYVATDGKLGYSIAPVVTSGYIEFWIFCYTE